MPKIIHYQLSRFCEMTQFRLDLSQGERVSTPPLHPHLFNVLQCLVVLRFRLLDLHQAAVPLVVLRHAHFL